MKLIPTASQTIGPFFSIGLAKLQQNTEAAIASWPNGATLQGVVSDGDGNPIPDGVLEFFANNYFARVPTDAAGRFQVIVAPSVTCYEVLVFMRGLLLPALTRVYLEESAAESDLALAAVPKERIPTLLAHATSTPRQFHWNVKMQGEDETVFFET